MMDKGNDINILVTTSSFAEEQPGLIGFLQDKGLRVVLNPWKRQLKEPELEELLHLHRPVGLLAGTEPITRNVLDRAKEHLKVISRVGVGWDNIDREAARELGTRVFRTEGVLSDAVAELTLGLILSAMRHISLQDRMVRQGNWQKKMGSLLKGKTLGIIGFGAIGRRVGELARAFGCRVIFHDEVRFDVEWAEGVTLDELLSRAQIISIHASGTTRIIDHEGLARLGNRGVVVVNTARGDLIDEDALYQGLTDGRIGFACMDVFGKEPYEGPFCRLENVLLTPHIGSYAREARILMESAAVENLLEGLRGLSLL